ncbi:MAG: hypothetical protein KBA06_06270, partial [Saprospiraceae bacterium]|nr:hypothetical protein [Saprospiraceae bacterium]
WEEVFIYLLKELRKPPNTIQKTKAIALLLHKENRSIELLELIRQSKSVDLFIKHIDGFYTLEPTDIYDVSIYILRYYLRNHVGRNISQKTKQMLDAMTANGLNDIVRQIIAILVSEYGERNSLMEELNLKIPDSDEN